MFALNVSNFGFILFLCFKPLSVSDFWQSFKTISTISLMLFLSLADVLLVFFPRPCGVWKNTANLADYLSVSFVKPSKKGPVLFFVKEDRRIGGGGGHIIFSGNRGGSVFVNRG